MSKGREIKPHKGGRDANLSIRLTHNEKARLQAQANRNGGSIADYIVKKVEEDEQAQQ